MTNAELNRDIKRLYKSFKNQPSGDTTNWSVKDWQNLESYKDELKKEFNRLYRADQNFEVLNITTLKMMLIINNSLRVIPFHVFGSITIKN